MLNIIFWIIAGLISGWIGYLASRRDVNADFVPFAIVGVVGGIIGGGASRQLGISAAPVAIDAESIFNALFVSAVFIVCYAVFSALAERNGSRHS